MLIVYSKETLLNEIKVVFSAVREMIEIHDARRFCFRDTVYHKITSNAQKQAFYAVFMAFYDLIIKNGCFPSSPESIMPELNNMTQRILIGQKHIKTADRLTNVRTVRGLIADFFAKRDVASFNHGPGIIFDFENSIRRSRTETARYEFKQGLLRLDSDRKIDNGMYSTIVQTICAIGNVGPGADGFLYLGIADKPADANRIKVLDGINPIPFDQVSIVGIDREASLLNQSLDKYTGNIADQISKSGLSEPLKSQVTSNLDVITYRGMSVVRIRIPQQTEISFVDNDCYIRSGPSTHKASGPQIAAISRLFG